MKKSSRIFNHLSTGYFCFILACIAMNSSFAHTGHDPSISASDHAILDETLAAEAARLETPFILNPQALTVATPDQLIDLGQWGAVINWPHIPVTAANLPDGKILTFASNQRDGFPGSRPEFTYAATWDPETGIITENDFTGHDMFCGHPVILNDGKVLISGGRNVTDLTTLFDPVQNSWVVNDRMNDRRWYPTAVALPNDKVFIASGSGGSNTAELWTKGQGWNLLSGINWQPIASYADGYVRPDWWPQLVLAPNGKINYIGPTPQMKTIDFSGNGEMLDLASTIADWDSSNQAGTSVLFDEGKVLTLGGRANRRKATIVDVNNSTPVVTAVNDMITPRSFANAVMLPNGEVLVVGGNTSGTGFSDNGTVLTPEIWNPETLQWREVADHSVPRNYHSIALLLTDGRVISAGGGLCGSGCAANHQDGQVYSPPYLFNSDGSLASRPVISNAPNAIGYNDSFTVHVTDNIQKFNIIKMSSTTHATNTDLRFLSLPFTSLGNGQYQITSHTNENVMTPGYWMMFAINSQGVPSKATVLRVSTDIHLTLSNPGNQTTAVGSSVNLAMTAFDPNDLSLSYVATGLPNGLTIDVNTGVITGVPLDTGVSQVTVTVSNSLENASLDFQWTIELPSTVVASYNTDFQGVTPASGRQYLWNANGPIGLSSNYIPMKWNGTAYDSDGVPGIPDNSNLAWGNLTASGGHPGKGTNQNQPTDRFVIAANNIQSDGQYKLGNTFINETNTGCGNGGQVRVYVNNTLQLSKDYPRAGSTDFNIDLGLLVNGDIVYVAAGPKAVDGCDGFVWDFSLIKELPANIPLTVDPIVSQPSQVNTSIAYQAVANGGINKQYNWNFGDGTGDSGNSSSANTSHTYQQPGIYNVSLIVSAVGVPSQIIQFKQLIHNALTTNRPNISTTILYQQRSGDDYVWNVNPDNNTITVFNTVSDSKVAEINVGKQPRALALSPEGDIWVVNKGDASISVIDGTTLSVINTIALHHGSQPAGIVFNPVASFAFVTLEAKGQLLKFDSNNGTVLDSLSIGSDPRHLSITADGNKVYVSRFITPPIPNEGTSAPQTENNGVKYGGEVVVVGTSSAMVIQRTITLEHSNTPDSAGSGRGIPNYLGAPVISPDGLKAWVPSKQDNILRGMVRDGNNLDHDNTVRAISSRINLVSQTEDYVARIDHNDAAMPSTALFGLYGNFMFTALEGNRQVIVTNAYAGTNLFFFDVGRAPQGLAISDDGKTLYTHNFTDRTISVHDIEPLIFDGTNSVSLVATYQTVANETLSSEVLKGKQLFYDSRDPRLALEEYLSCASCHNDGDSDGRVWDMTGFGEGLRNTISLIGHGGVKQGPLHWTGNFDEVHDFEGQIRNLAGGTGLMNDGDFFAGSRSESLGDSKAGISSDLDALAAYVTSLNEFGNSPYRNADGTMTSAGLAGKVVFQNNGCAQCHSGNELTDSVLNNFHDVGTILSASGSRLGQSLIGLDTPTLLGIWETAPYLHNGSAATLADAISAHDNVNISASDMSNLVDYLKQIEKSSQVYKIQGEIGKYLSFNMSEANSEVCRQGAPDYPRVTGLPAGMNRSGCGIYGKPQISGTYRLTFPIVGGEWLADLVVSGGGGTTNQPPALTNPGIQNNVTGAVISLALVASDPDGDTLSYSATGLPSGLLINNTTGVISGTLAVNSMGSHNVSVSVNDGHSHIVNVTFSWQVTDSDIPPPEVYQIQGMVGEFMIFNMIDVTSEVCRQGAPDYPRITGLPAGMFRSGCSIYGRPESASTSRLSFPVIGGEWLADLVVSGGDGTTNQPPVITNPEAQNSVLGEVISLPVLASDVDGDVLTYSAAGLPQGLQIDSSSGIISGTLVAESLGSHAVTITVNDGQNHIVSINFNWLVIDGDIPPPDVYQIQGVVGQYLSFNMADVTSETCRQGAPDYPRVTGLPAGVFRSGCIVYGRPESAGTSRLIFPVVGGEWLADLVVSGG